MHYQNLAIKWCVHGWKMVVLLNKASFEQQKLTLKYHYIFDVFTSWNLSAEIALFLLSKKQQQKNLTIKVNSFFCVYILKDILWTISYLMVYKQSQQLGIVWKVAQIDRWSEKVCINFPNKEMHGVVFHYDYTLKYQLERISETRASWHSTIKQIISSWRGRKC